MSIWNEANRDAMSMPPNEASGGNRLGFLKSFESAYDLTTRYYSMFGAEEALRQEELANSQRIRDAGGEPPELDAPRAFNPLTPYTDVIEDLTNPDTERSRRRIGQKREDKLRGMKAQFPKANIMTYGEMFANVRRKSDEARARAERETTISGDIGWFLGGAVGGLDPRTDPLNFVTIPIGFGGKTVLQRIAGQALVQGGAEAGSQVLGARENQRALGGDPTIQESLLQIGVTAAGGALFQGVAEGVGALGRRWFRNVPGDPAPPLPDRPRAPEPGRPPETRVPDSVRYAMSDEAEARVQTAVREVAGNSRAAQRAGQADFFHVRSQIDDFAGPQPWEVPPTTHSRVYDPSQTAGARAAVSSLGETVDDIARRIDPDTFKIYDKLAAKKEQARALLEEGKLERQAQMDAATRPLSQEISALKERVAKANKRKTKKYAERLTEAERELADITARTSAADTENMAAARQLVMQADEKMRDLAPVVSRAYARAQGKWKVYNEQAQQIDAMVQAGKRTADAPSPVVDKAETDFFARPSMQEIVPETASPSFRPEGRDIMPEIKRVNTEALEATDEAADTFATTLSKTLDDETITELEVPGYEAKVKLSDGVAFDEDGKVTLTVRDVLKEAQQDREVLQAVTSCSVVKASASV